MGMGVLVGAHKDTAAYTKVNILGSRP
jgi:hypothetical protein